MLDYRPHLMAGMRLCGSDAPAIRLIGQTDTGEWFCVLEGNQEMTLTLRTEAALRLYRPDQKDPATKGCLEHLAEEALEWARDILKKEG